jgi:hypothetical protein
VISVIQITIIISNDDERCEDWAQSAPGPFSFSFRFPLLFLCFPFPLLFPGTKLWSPAWILMRHGRETHRENDDTIAAVLLHSNASLLFPYEMCCWLPQLLLTDKKRTARGGNTHVCHHIRHPFHAELSSHYKTQAPALRLLFSILTYSNNGITPQEWGSMRQHQV